MILNFPILTIVETEHIMKTNLQSLIQVFHDRKMKELSFWVGKWLNAIASVRVGDNKCSDNYWKDTH